jgi:hypothetical protein
LMPVGLGWNDGYHLAMEKRQEEIVRQPRAC